MKLLFAYEIDGNIRPKLGAIKELTNEIEQKAEQLKTVLGLEYIGIKLIIQEVLDGYEEFVKPQKPRYKKKFTLKNPLLGDSSYEGYLSFELLFSTESYHQILTSNDAFEIKRLVNLELLKAEDVFKEMENKLGRVDTNEFSELISETLV
ncbi:hypothetical protein BGP78_19160 [Pseudoalteromonas sp. MSK9-3]|uniref:hypothetical protein n=1 Tax=Pseudoalteromonas sp. MSK9-3 TaxID=1897633 RepID=UPI000E6CA60E|nr:hypothetical protein [Pseudoalteromonas sp. MSK9-3]RJE73248.1 hypothetical protein BGP78_19160 [Pseudoalteromonas sp. MSK9-3]